MKKQKIQFSSGAAVMTCSGGGSAEPYTPTPAATEVDESVTTGRDNERRRRRAAASNTFLTSGLTPPTTTTGTKTLLGQ